MNHRPGFRASGSEAAVTGGQTLYAQGPPSIAGLQARGLYIKESATVYRWIEDQPLGASATVPTTYSNIAQS